MGLKSYNSGFEIKPIIPMTALQEIEDFFPVKHRNYGLKMP